MSLWIPDIQKSDSTLYRAIAKSIQHAIKTGALKPGDRLLPHRQMSEKLNVTVGTVARGYNLASSWGIISSKVGRGTIVGQYQDADKNIPLQLNGSQIN